MAKAGPGDKLGILSARLTAETASRTFSKWLDETRTIPDGIIAASDVIAMSVLQVLAERGVSIVGQMHVTGYDDLPFASQTIPTLSTVRQELTAGAAHLVDLLFRRIAGEHIGSVVPDPQLVVRQSS